MAIKDEALSIASVKEKQEPRQRPLSLLLIGRVLYLARQYRFLIIGLSICVLLRATQIPLMRWLVSAVLQGPILQKDAALLRWAIVGVVAMGLSTAFVMRYRMLWALRLGENVVRDLRGMVFDHVQRMPMAFYDKTKLGRIISRVSSDCENVRVGVQNVLFITIVASGNALVMAMMLIWTDKLLFLVALCAAPLYILLNQIFRRFLSRAYRDIQESYSLMTSNIAESVNGMHVTQAFVREGHNAMLFDKLIDLHARNIIRSNKLQGLFLPGVECLTQYTMAIVFVVGAWRILSPDITPEQQVQLLGALVVYAIAMPDFFKPIQIVARQYNEALTAMASAERVFSLLDKTPESLCPEEDNAAKLPVIKGDIRFEEVCFEYNPDDPVLKDINFELGSGKTLALVGHTGSGKSTIANLICRFYAPAKGTIFIDDIPLNQLSELDLRQQMAIVTQRNFLFKGTVRDNFEMVQTNITEAQIWQACDALDVTDLMQNLPDGLNSDVGETGERLSLGQRQLICMVRAMLKNPRLLILDEATASIDSHTEARLQTALMKLRQGRTSIIVAHRLNTIQHADLILVLKEGVCVERGTHQELVAKEQVYAGLYKEFSH